MTSPHVELVGDELHLTFPYSPGAIQAVRAVGHARWDTEAKRWTIPYSRLAISSVKKIFPNLSFGDALRAEHADEAVSLMEAEELKYLPGSRDVDVSDFKFKTAPMWHQKVSFNFARRLEQYALFLEQGLGKTKIDIDVTTWRFRRGDVFRCLYVAPNSVVPNWTQEDVRQQLHDDFNHVVLLRGSTKDKIKQLEQIYHEDVPGWILVNYDSLRNLEAVLVKMQAGCCKLFQKMDLDEASRIKHASSQRSKSAWKIGKTVRLRSIMTGTPITQSGEDVFAQYRFMNDRIFGPYATAFRGQYMIMGGFENRQVVGYRNFPDFVSKVYSAGIRFTKDRCLDLPKKIYERRTATLDEVTSKLYRNLEKECVAKFGEAEIATPLVMTKLMKLSQITGGFLYEQGADGKRTATHRLPSNPKLDVLGEILDDVLPKKVVVWCRFTEEVAMITAMLQERRIGHVKVDGSIQASGLKNGEKICKCGDCRGCFVERFQTDEATRVFVGQVSTAGLGITLTAAKVAVYYSNTYALEERLQSEDRNHRIGQDQSVLYVDIVAELASGRQTIDHDVLDVLRGKSKFANEVSLALMQRMTQRSESDKPIRNPAFIKKHTKNADFEVHEAPEVREARSLRKAGFEKDAEIMEEGFLDEQ